ncbi:hypothetical protein Ppa06_58470 [Planomonospora parontospora subsp. parontospora]|uniref:LTD domain-containing protein n=2 Tax=Planomonospora parontospora TaxID=58119 RepID=A0AA37BME0_9ACTN|nr:lamin tail domain-containing protein [Planomonospora parontospora]GGK91128.1 hypothetical protein GCM10010126_58190 [Planomonospora parontospora]GII12049.1 hypothetical protein Ppa06_58470 [Planomonospora parontospora subsp. parontospora]
MRKRLLVSAALAASAVALPSAAQPAAAATPSIQIIKIYYDSPGSDRGGNTSINGEYVVIKNTTRRTIDLADWTLRDPNFRYTFGDVTLRAGKTLTIRSGQGSDGASTVYWQRRWYVWNNDRDTAHVRNASGRLIDSCSYNSTRYDYKNCQ